MENNKIYYSPSSSIPHVPVRYGGWKEKPYQIFKTFEECKDYCNKLNKKYSGSENKWR